MKKVIVISIISFSLLAASVGARIVHHNHHGYSHSHTHGELNHNHSHHGSK